MRIFRYLRDKYFRKRGLLKQDKSKKDYLYDKHFKVSGTSVDYVDLRSNFKKVIDQKTTNACTGFAVGAMCEYLLDTEFEKGWRKISPLYNWYWGKDIHGYPNDNKGVWLRHSLTALFDKGFIYEQTMPFKQIYTRSPTDFENSMGMTVKTLYFNKKRFGYYLMQPNQEMIKDALKRKNPIVFGMFLNNSFYGNNDGEISTIDNNGLAHAMVIVGFDDEKQQYIVRNSWSSSWGDDGYCYVPYDYLEANSFDLWTIRRKAS